MALDLSIENKVLTDRVQVPTIQISMLAHKKDTRSQPRGLMAL